MIKIYFSRGLHVEEDNGFYIARDGWNEETQSPIALEESLEESFESRINIIDSNNKVVGYDFGQTCCEDFYLRISQDFVNQDFTGEFDDEGDCIKFFLTGGGVLELHNHHNGYYSHDFKFTQKTDDGEEVLTEGWL